jgi:hypothetical protein
MCAPVFCVFYSVCVYRCVGLFFVCSVLCSCADVCVFVHSRRGQNRILVSSSITLPYCLETEFLMEQGAHGVWLGWLPRQLSETTHLLVLPTSPHSQLWGCRHTQQHLALLCNCWGSKPRSSRLQTCTFTH